MILRPNLIKRCTLKSQGMFMANEPYCLSYGKTKNMVYMIEFNGFYRQ